MSAPCCLPAHPLASVTAAVVLAGMRYITAGLLLEMGVKLLRLRYPGMPCIYLAYLKLEIAVVITSTRARQ